MLVSNPNCEIKLPVVDLSAEESLGQPVGVRRTFAIGEDHIAVQSVFSREIKEQVIDKSQGIGTLKILFQSVRCPKGEPGSGQTPVSSIGNAAPVAKGEMVERSR